MVGLAERKTFNSKSQHLRHRPPSRVCRSKCPHCVAVTTETLETLVSGNGYVSTLHTHKATVSCRAHQHEVINQNAVRATGLFDHGWLLGGVGLSQSDGTPELLRQKDGDILRSTSLFGRGLAVYPRHHSRWIRTSWLVKPGDDVACERAMFQQLSSNVPLPF